MYNLSSIHRTTAIDRLEHLRDCLRSQTSSNSFGHLVEECNHLVKAVETFHMEAIRFRMFGLSRQLELSADSVPKDAKKIFEEAREALQVAGFLTR